MVEAWLPDDTEAVREHRLDGLEPDNLLAFMALIGLLRALEMARPGWRPRAFWDVENHPWRPVLTLAEPQTQKTVAEAAAEGVKAFNPSAKAICDTAIEFEIVRNKDKVKRLSENEKPTEKQQKDLKKIKRGIETPREPEKVTYIASNEDEIKRGYCTQNLAGKAMVSGLVGLEITHRGERKASASPLKLTSGQQAFAGLFLTLTKEPLLDEIARSLFQPWLYLHRGDSFRLSGAEARRYAYSARDPAKKEDKVEGQTGSGVAPSERGANTLACLGFPSFPVITTPTGVRISSQNSDPDTIMLPLWSTGSKVGASLRSIEAILFQSSKNAAAVHRNVVGWQAFKIVEIEAAKSSKYKAIAPLHFVSART